MALVSAGLAALTGLIHAGNISSVYDDSDLGSDAISVGFGLWLVVIAGVLGVALSVVAMVRRG